MSYNLLKNLAILIIAPVLLLSFTVIDNASFSGNWSLNESKSDMGQFANFVPRKIQVTQTSDSITTTKTSSGFNGEDVTITETLPFDGKEIESSLFGNSKRKAKAQWSDNGQTLTVTFNLKLDFDGQVTDVNGIEKWTLGDGGKSLSLESNSSSSFGDNAYKGVYEK